MPIIGYNSNTDIEFNKIKSNELKKDKLTIILIEKYAELKSEGSERNNFETQKLKYKSDVLEFELERFVCNSIN